jgi:diguanylate cyclase
MLSCGCYGVVLALYALLTTHETALSVLWIAIGIVCQGGIAIATLLLILEREAVTASIVRKSHEELVRNHEALKFESSYDASLQIWNRRAVLDVLSKELKRAKRTQTPVSVFLADLDLFKRVNDVYGHLVGDDVLRGAAQRMSTALRDSDYLGRYGGEEFLAVLPACNAEHAREVAERVRQGIGNEPLANGVSITISIGVSQWR